jgi:membrane-associated phospholipid phosphatase
MTPLEIIGGAAIAAWAAVGLFYYFRFLRWLALRD